MNKEELPRLLAAKEAAGAAVSILLMR